MVRARQEYGADARIVRADKVKSGGFLGFFTREHYELTVEISDAAIVQAAATRAPFEAAPPVAGADAALAAEIADAQAAREAMLSGAMSEYAGATPSVARVDAPLAATPPAPTASAAIAPREIEDVAEFDRLVLQLTAQAATVAAPERERSFVPATFPVAERTHPRSGGGAGVGGFASGPDSDAMDHSGAEPPASARPARPTSPTNAHAVGGVVLHRWGVFTDIASAVATHCTVPALLSLGVPLRCVEDYKDLDAPVPLLDVVARFGTPPVRRPEAGDLIVVAGPADHAVAVATQLAAWVGLPATAVVLAGEIDAIRGHGRRIRDLDHARAARSRAAKAAVLGEPLIVALGVAPGRRGAAAAAPMLGAFGADTAWAVVDATKRPSTYEPSVNLLAHEARIDALAAVNVAEAQAPCAMLEASLPVAWMDGLPAAGVVWAAMLGERIAALD